mgnify:CR=1 FL=1
MSDQSTREGRFLTGSTMGHVLRMTLSGTAGITFLFLVDAANLFWISWLGETKLVAAMGFAFAVQFFSISFGIGLMIAATALVSRSIGQRKREQAREQAGAAMVMAVIFQSLVALIMVLFADQLVELTGAVGDTAEFARRYLVLTLPSLPLMAAGMIGGAIMRAEGDALRAMLVTMGPGVVSAAVDPFLIITLDLRLDGAALAVWASRIAMAAIGLYFVVKTHDLLARPKVTTLKATFRPYAGIAGPAMLTQLATPFGSYLLTTVVAGFGDNAMAAWAVVNRLTVLAFGGIFSLSGAVGGIFGQNFGAGRYDRLKMTYRDALIFCVAYPVTVWIILMSLHESLVTGFGLTTEGGDLLYAFTHVGAGFFMFTGMIFVATAAFNNTGRPIYSTGINWVREGLVTLPLALWLSSIYGASGVIYAQAIVGVVLGLIVTLWAYRFIAGAPKTNAR